MAACCASCCDCRCHTHKHKEAAKAYPTAARTFLGAIYTHGCMDSNQLSEKVLGWAQEWAHATGKKARLGLMSTLEMSLGVPDDLIVMFTD